MVDSRVVFSVCLILLCAPFCVLSNSVLKVTFPNSLFEDVNSYTHGTDGSIPELPALFGQPNFGFILSRSVYIANVPSGCTPIDAAASGVPRDNTTGLFDPFFLLITRGNNCSFVTKILNAQNAGAVGVIMVNIPIPPDAQQQYGYNDQLVYMADTPPIGSKISIPSMLVGRTLGEKIRSYLNTSTPQAVMLAMNFYTANPDNRTEWELWTSSYSLNADLTTFYKTMGTVVNVFADRALFSPHYVLLPPYLVPGCSWGSSCNNQCVASMSLCAQNVVYDSTYAISGITIIKEDVRQLCVYNSELAANSTRVGNYWFLYVAAFQARCSPPNALNFNDDCANIVLTRLADTYADFKTVNLPWIKQCILDNDLSGTSDLLAWEANNQTIRWNYNLPILPSVFVNEGLAAGSLVCQGQVTSKCSLVDDICNGFETGSAPAACVESDCALGVPLDPCGVCGGNGGIDLCDACLPVNSSKWNACVGCDGKAYSGKVMDTCGKCGGAGDSCASSTSGAVTGIIIGIVLGAAALFGVMAFLIYRQRSRMKADVNVLLQQYVPLAENVGPAAGRNNTNSNRFSRGSTGFPPRHNSDPDRASLVSGSASTSEEDL